MTTVVELVVAAEPAAWRAAGFDVGADGTCMLADIRLHLTGTGGINGMTAWVLADAPDPMVRDIDGLATAHASADDPVIATVHPNGVTSIDQVVVNTPDLERTCAAIEAVTAAPLKRIREAGAMRQGFHRLGSLIIEVVSHPGVVGDHAKFWGLALNADDLDAMYAQCGDAAMSAPKDAVQTGRRIASFRESGGLGLPVAVMTPHVRR
jgi:hypothetical protein